VSPRIELCEALRTNGRCGHDRLANAREYGLEWRVQARLGMIRLALVVAALAALSCGGAAASSGAGGEAGSGGLGQAGSGGLGQAGSGGLGQAGSGGLGGQPPAGCDPDSEPPTSGPHAYFGALVARPDCLHAFSLRDQAQIDAYKKDSYDGIVSYDPENDPHPQRQDAMKLFWPPGVVNMNQVRLPIGVTRPETGSTKVLIVSDHWWDDSWFTEFKWLYTSASVPDGEIRPMGIWKWLNVTDNYSGGEKIWMEPQMDHIGEDPPTLSWFAARSYASVREPTVLGGEGTKLCGKNFGSSKIGPMLNCFQAKAFTWTRAFIEVEHRAGDEYARVSFWMADETQEAMPIFLDAQLLSGGTSVRFWIEYNSSKSNRVGGEMTAYARNVVMLKDVANPESLFARPTN
jgi:hypothetical protein